MKIAVGLSGGVDSSVAALLLKQAGYDVFALFMQNWHDTTGTLHGDCEWEEDKVVAEMVAKKIGIPFHFVDLSDTYRLRVVDYMFDEYEKGRTPNPDVLCNREIKFDAFLKCAIELGADYVATGHYCRKDEFADANGKTIYRILAGADGNKDQSYFLCQLSQEQLSKAMFPIGDLMKPEVRRIAKEADLPSAEKKDSQGICFVGKVDLPIFLQQKLKAKEGRVVEIFPDFYDNVESKDDIVSLSTPLKYLESDGKVIGKHQGAQFYTIGQRKGLNIGGHKEPLFIIANDMDKNIIYVGEGQNHPGLYRKALHILNDEIHWIRPDLKMTMGEQRDYLIRIRYRQPLQHGKLIYNEEGLYILFNEPQRGITPGQFAAWYNPDGEMIGSGVINK
ncbi:MAG: tRNA 2-thiouridine(34) synthase MnmA [Bacteroidales bacterium]|nr:tRNA 2-thiouridine(34) synthase MnmA [Bacteroidales bacterium]